MKELKRYIAIGLLFPMIASCVSTEDPAKPADDYNNLVIGFRSSLDTRATVENFSGGDAIKVWGYKRQDGSTWEQVFGDAGEDLSIEVSFDGSSWNYNNYATQYWEAGNQYTFHSLYANAAGTETPTYAFNISGNTLTISDFDATNHVDLLHDVVIRDYDREGGAPVSFNFKHLLSQVTFVGKADATLAANEVQVILTSAKLYGMPKTGNWTSTGSWTFSASNTSSTDPFVERLNADEIVLTESGVDLFDDRSKEGGEDNQILIFPLASLSTAIFEITFHYRNNVDETLRTQYVNLGNILNAPTAWEAGKRYQYTFTIGSNDYIFFAGPTVDKWKPNDIGNDSALDQENQGN